MVTKLGHKLCQLFAVFCAPAALVAAGSLTSQAATLIDAADVVPRLVTDIRYAGPHNFVGRPIDGYRAPHCLLTRPAAEALAEVARDLAGRGLVLKAFDCYRPTRAV